MSDQISLEDIASLAKRRGFIYQGSDIYGGLAGTWDYGPLGVALKRNIMNLWWKMFVDSRDDMYGVDAAILMNQKVWQASGHVETFADPLITCENCNSRFRVDQFIDDLEYKDLRHELLEFINDARLGALNSDHESVDDDVEVLTRYLSNEPNEKLSKVVKDSLGKISDRAELIAKVTDWANGAARYVGVFPKIFLTLHDQKCPTCGKVQWSDATQFNMMFKTFVGSVSTTIESEQYNGLAGELTLGDSEFSTKVVIPYSKQLDSAVFYNKKGTSYLRPETAQGIFTNFKNVVDSFYPDVPFGLAQQGKAFRNEISPRDFVFRSREFEQMEVEYFVHPEEWEVAFESWRKAVHEWCKALGLPEDKVHELEVPEHDRAHYSKRTIDFEFDFPHGRHELLGLAYRTDFDLGNIQRVSGKSMEYRPKDGGKPFVPHVIEPSFGVERAIMAVLTSAYTEDEMNGEKRIFLKLPKDLAPIKAAVSPLLKNKPELVAKAKEVYDMLKKELGAVMWDDNGNIGKRYRRQDEIGTPVCITIDFDTLEDGTVTVRNRDTAAQERIAIDQLLAHLLLG
ncbi:MAG: glycine--tRNA ligase [Candidatus Saccharimonadales bacterium]